MKKNYPTKELNHFRGKIIFFQLDQFPGMFVGLHDINAGMRHWRNVVEMKENVGTTSFSS